MNVDYGEIIKKSWQLTKKNRWLWIYGLVLTATSAGSSGSSNLTSRFKPSDIKENIPSELPEKTTKVLGFATNAAKEWINTIPASTWVILGFGLFILIIFFFIIHLIIRNWAKAGLIAGIKQAEQGKETNLSSTSPSSIVNVWPLILYNLIMFAVTVCVLLGLGMFVGLGYLLFSFLGALQTLWLVFSAIAGILGFLIVIVLFAAMGVYAERLIVFYKKSSWQAWKEGLKLAWRHFLPTLVMGIVNFSIGCSIGCLSLVVMGFVLGIPALILIVPSFINGFRFPGWPAIGVLGLLFLILVNLNFLLRAIFTVFQYGAWNLFFQKMMEEEKNAGR